MLLLTAAGWSLVSGERTSLFLGFLLTLLTRNGCERGQRKCNKVFSRWSMVNAAWNVNPLHVWVRPTFLCVCACACMVIFFLLFFFNFLLTAEKMCPFNESFCLPSCWEWGAAGLKSLSLSGLMFVSICMLMWKQKKKKKRGWSVFCLCYFLATLFFFCCKLVSVIDPVASLTHLAFWLSNVFGPLFLSTACFLSFFFFFYLTPVDVLFAGGGAEQAVD